MLRRFGVRRAHGAKGLLCLLLLVGMLLSGCQGDSSLVKFPMGEADVAAAVEKTGLSWSVVNSQEVVVGKDKSTVYTMHSPEYRDGYNNLFITSYDTKELGRTLVLQYHEPQDMEWRQHEEAEAKWEDWRGMLTLAANLYGGFTDAEEIYNACSATEMPKDEHILWQGSLSGGYFLMASSGFMNPERLKMGNGITMYIFESEAAYEKENQRQAEIREQKNSNAG